MIELCKFEDCTGCAACVNACATQCIEMKSNKEGFLYPEIDQEKCVECGACTKVCPELNNLSFSNAPKVYAAFNNDLQVRQKSSSGGMFYAMASKMISNGGFVVGAAFNDDLVLEHRIASSIDEVIPMMGSKYLQSTISNDLYRNILKLLRQGKEVLFTGTPCQVAGCKQFVPNKYQDKLFLVDLVCHGVPSQLLFSDYLKKLKKKVNFNIEKFNFRTSNGWGVTPSIVDKNGVSYILKGKENLYMSLFLNGYTFRENCYRCPYASSKRVSDMTIADFWGIGTEKPFNHDVTSGVSLLLVNSQNGEELLRSLSDAITVEERSLSEAIRANLNLRLPSSRPFYRNTVYDYTLNHNIEDTYDFYFNSLYRRIRKVIGRIVRKFK